ncbi:hypothetical protein NADFUDRAFT_52309 [Nadsonia fulvescens var. elongata DSM 6958]|uniref:SGF29 C-terminal domain-containing protein n=1 Tax=Nadsonia fulvescens var. elongata DSM 6958 TaxID=857566 RepID=A0A1E3PH94_9ASCO|nr:hypothetical protein NADFUDRAFT_52309 [Nadsonia fulvescens var. elongata DSM 6958]
MSRAGRSRSSTLSGSNLPDYLNPNDTESTGLNPSTSTTPSTMGGSSSYYITDHDTQNKLYSQILTNVVNLADIGKSVQKTARYIKDLSSGGNNSQNKITLNDNNAFLHRFLNLVETHDDTIDQSYNENIATNISHLLELYMEDKKYADAEKNLINQALESISILMALKQSDLDERQNRRTGPGPSFEPRKKRRDNSFNYGDTDNTSSSNGDGALESITSKDNLSTISAPPTPAQTTKKTTKSPLKPEPEKDNLSVGASSGNSPKIGSQVAFRLPNASHQPQDEEEWIQCEVTKVLTPYSFEVRDPEPDETGNLGQTYRAQLQDIIVIPPREQTKYLPTIPTGSVVLARYPETTTFYRAEVCGFRRDGRYRLKFEGEEEVGKEMEVEKYLVLSFPK